MKIGAKTLAKLELFAGTLAEICSRSLAAPGSALRWTVIANPGAGGFTIHSRWKKHRTALAGAREKAGNNPPRKDAGPSETAKAESAQAGISPPNTGITQGLGSHGFIPTQGPGHAVKITQALLAEAEGPVAAKAAEKTDSSGKPFYLIITAGGDGTSLEGLQTLYLAKPALRSRFAVLRLPMGTGNDGADAAELADALELLVGPVKLELSRGLKLSTATGKTWSPAVSADAGAVPPVPFLAFNILSVGLDAFVTHMTNKMKGKLPGDSYKLWVDIASLLYDKLYKVGPMEVKGYDGKKETASFTEKVLLCAMGVRGHRSYGSHKLILPDDRNVCVMKQMPLLRKVALKELFNTGGHVDKPESILWNADRIVITGVNPILAQMDGETVLLTKEDFPAVIELTEPAIQILRRE
jgi:diacylglycerol kinase family enzyme